VPAQAAIAAAGRPAAVAIADPCHDRSLPRQGGLDGAAQRGALVLLDRAACSLGSSREELALAIADKRYARGYERRYGVDPRSPAALLRAVAEREAGPLVGILGGLLP
ncbi:MAG TPA: hypothetical protein VHB30_13950, partial [Solirubrobacteraceae bacterium]|nr:hypothetical protein [Solirubrobacteraceae bacterium]